MPATRRKRNLRSGASSPLLPTGSGVNDEPKLYVLPKKLFTTLRLLNPFVWPDSVDYREIIRLFEDGWKHKHKTIPKIRRILAVNLPDDLKESYQDYKADDYTSAHWPSDHKVMIVAKAALGKSSIQYRNSQHLTAPPHGYDSVFGEVGVALNYDEQVLYKNEAIRPAYIVVYERPSA
ncbi:hypothetical protein FRC00_001835 [Tulasnella sp. 408]|nr:hypothetical protein FRC00_001835 [Tulasnella sp. 408]